jgi:hypothetical protein
MCGSRLSYAASPKVGDSVPFAQAPTNLDLNAAYVPSYLLKLVGKPIARGTSNGWNFFCGLISMAMMPDACNLFVGFMPVNSTYFNYALIQDMINKYGQDH